MLRFDPRTPWDGAGSPCYRWCMDAITLVPSQTAPLVVDVQEKLPPAMHAPDAARMLRAIDLLLEAFDAVASRDPGCKATALSALAAHGVTVTTTETVVFDLLGDAKNLHFRPLSRLVKDLLG